MSHECAPVHNPKRIVLTGGPGAGKTALLELVRQSFCSQVKILPEAASIIFGGGFPRHEDAPCRRASQRAIYHVQCELEATADAHPGTVILCDRGRVDGLAYWPGEASDFWRDVKSDLASELARYDVVIHMQSPKAGNGYNHENPLRTESAATAALIDARIQDAWAQHPRRYLVPSATTFFDKCAMALEILRNELPDCCRRHVIPSIDRSEGNPDSEPPVAR